MIFCGQVTSVRNPTWENLLTGLGAAWKFEEGNAQARHYSQVGVSHLDVVDSAAITDGMDGRGIDLTGGYLQKLNDIHQGYNSALGMTLSGWVKLANAGDHPTIISRNQNITGLVEYEVWWEDDEILFGWNNKAGSVAVPMLEADILADFQYFGFTVTDAEVQGFAGGVWVNGGPPSIPSNPTGYILVGQRGDGSNPLAKFDGYMDELYRYDRNLSRYEIEQGLFNNGEGRFHPFIV